jgi:hypothetical protein
MSLLNTSQDYEEQKQIMDLKAPENPWRTTHIYNNGMSISVAKTRKLETVEWVDGQMGR